MAGKEEVGGKAGRFGVRMGDQGRPSASGKGETLKEPRGWGRGTEFQSWTVMEMNRPSEAGRGCESPEGRRGSEVLGEDVMTQWRLVDSGFPPY
jgi:hypothetical protein